MHTRECPPLSLARSEGAVHTNHNFLDHILQTSVFFFQSPSPTPIPASARSLAQLAHVNQVGTFLLPKKATVCASGRTASVRKVRAGDESEDAEHEGREAEKHRLEWSCERRDGCSAVAGRNAAIRVRHQRDKGIREARSISKYHYSK